MHKFILIEGSILASTANYVDLSMGACCKLSKKATFQLKQSPAVHFFAFHNNLRTAITASKFSYDILPAPVDLDCDIDLRNMPVHGETIYQDGWFFGLDTPCIFSA